MYFSIATTHQPIIEFGEVWALQLHYFFQYCRFYVFDPPSASFLAPYLTFQVIWSNVTTWEGYVFQYSYYTPTYNRIWRSLSTPTALFSLILAIFCFWATICGPLFFTIMIIGISGLFLLFGNVYPSFFYSTRDPVASAPGHINPFWKVYGTIWQSLD